MKLTLKCLIDFRSWLDKNFKMKLHEFNDLPEFVQNAYYLEFFDHAITVSDNELIKTSNEIYNKKFA